MLLKMFGKNRAVVQGQGKDERCLLFSKRDQWAWAVPVAGAVCESVAIMDEEERHTGQSWTRRRDIPAVEDLQDHHAGERRGGGRCGGAPSFENVVRPEWLRQRRTVHAAAEA